MDQLQDFKKEFERSFKEARGRGYSIKKIKAELVNQGYEKNNLNKFIINYYAKKANIILIIIALFLVLILTLYFFNVFRY